ncbi:MAG TPA: UDP-3-O-(3-hydroxymyristoyl)glucosamine N-acyltransferase [Burkholderiales bacterium]|nr:UDP-3-O-(3-hydroxymyristoyl)glucosamine N-acyltransferase [Burkholderiales bacterium]
MPEPLTLAQIAARLGGRVVGDAEVLIGQVGSLEGARAGQIAFLANPKYRAGLATTRAAAVVLAPAAESLTRLPRIVSDNPYAYFARLSQLFNPVGSPQPGIDARASVSPGATIPPSARIEAGAVIEDGARLGERVSIGAGCHLGANVAIGDDSRLYPSVVVYAGCRIGARAVIHSGVVIGADGFGIAEDAGVWVKVPQIGAVVVGDDVEIGANTTIDRGTIDDTVIEDGVKLDNQIQIGHNVRVGAHTAMAGFSGVAGSADIGRHCTIGAAAIILGHLTIVDHVHVSAATVISRSIRQPGTYSGMFPFDEHASWARNTALVRHLDELAQRIRALEKHIAGEGQDE